MSLLQQLESKEIPYTPTVVYDLIRSNRSKYGAVQPEAKQVIFFMMKRIVIRGATKFIMINRNRRNEVTFYTIEDIIQELYIVLNRCVDIFDTEKNMDFYFYYNRAVDNRVIRIANYKRVKRSGKPFSDVISENSDEKDIEIERLFGDEVYVETHIEEFFWQEIESKYNKKEVDLMKSMLRNHKITDVIKETNMSKSEFNKRREDIIQKLKK